MAIPLSQETLRRLVAVFLPNDQPNAIALLVNECADNLPRCERNGPEELERVRFAAIKVSGGSLTGLRQAIQLAQWDWRDLLGEAGFADDVAAHKDWHP